MIGTNIRGIRHLFRLLDSPLNKILMSAKANAEQELCYVVKADENSMYILNTSLAANDDCYDFLSRLSEDVAQEVRHILSTTHSRIFRIQKRDNYRELNSRFRNIILLPKNFDALYDTFVRENSKMFKNITSKYAIGSDTNILKKLFVFTEDSKNFFQWAVDLVFKEGCQISTIANILAWNECYSQLTNKLKRGGTITAYTHSRSIHELMAELKALRAEKRVNDAINSFNTTQKKLLKQANGKLERAMLSKFSRLSEVKRTNFIKKVSSIDDYDELIRQLRHVTSTHFDWSKESLMDFLQNVDGINYEVVYDSKDIVLVLVKDYETIKQLGKTTNWCISKNKTYWNSYIGDTEGKSKQYMLFDFSKLEDDKTSIIGFTLTKNAGISSAHNFVNDNLMGPPPEETRSIHSFLGKFNNMNNIYGIIENCGININLIEDGEKPKYEWAYEPMMEYLNSIVNKNNVKIIAKSDKKVVLSVKDKDIAFFFGSGYMSKVPSHYFSYEHIIFADFEKRSYDPYRLIFGIINIGDYNEEFCENLWSSSFRPIAKSFDSFLSEFDAPYDCIRRPNDIVKRATNGFYDMNSTVVKRCIKENSNSFHAALKNGQMSYNEIFEIFSCSLISHLSFDFIDMVYDNGHTLLEYFPNEYVGNLIKVLIVDMIDTPLWSQRTLEVPSEKDIEDFYQEKINDMDKIKVIGYYLALKKIIGHEKISKDNFIGLFRGTMKVLNIRNAKGPIIKDILYLIYNKADFSRSNEVCTNIIKYFIRMGDNEMIDTINVLKNKYEWVAKIVNEENENLKFQESFRKKVSIWT